MATRVYYANNACYIDGIDLPIVAGTLTATLVGDGVQITADSRSYPLTSIPWNQVANQRGDTFDTPDAVMAYLTGIFVQRRPVGGVASYVAGTDLGGHKALMFDPAGSGAVVYVDPEADDYAFAGISLNAATAGAAIDAMTDGLIVEPSWSWQPLRAVYVAPAGALTQAVPTAGLFHLLGFAPTTTSIRIAPAPLVMLA